MTKNTTYDKSPGAPHDRGSADAWYRRGCIPHYYKGRSRVKKEDMTTEEIAAYTAGFDDGMEWGEHKDYR